jgi:hypothetical protein
VRFYLHTHVARGGNHGYATSYPAFAVTTTSVPPQLSFVCTSQVATVRPSAVYAQPCISAAAVA